MGRKQTVLGAEFSTTWWYFQTVCLPFLVFFILFSKRVMFFFLKFYSQARISIKGRFLILMYSIPQVYRILLDSANIETYYIREQIISKMEQ